MWAVLIAPGAALARLASLEVTKNVLRALLFSGVILAAVGIVQVFAFYMTGVDFLPIGIFSGEEMRSGLFGTDDFMGGRVFRASALGGEPKHLAYTLAVCLTVVVGDRLFGDFLGIQRRQFLLVSGVMVAGLTATFSTQGFALLALNSGILLAGAAVMRGSWKRMPAIAVLLVGVLLAAWFIPGLRAVLYDRTFVRMAETGGVEDWNEAVWEWFRVSPYSWPFGVGLGNVHLHASGFVPSESLSYMGGNVFVAKAGILRILSELGIVGLIVFLAALIRPLKVLWVRARRGSSVAGFIGTVTIAIVVDFLISFDGPAYIFLFIGVAAAVARCLSWSQSTQPSTGGAQRAVATS
jgi:O-antigen ligase